MLALEGLGMEERTILDIEMGLVEQDRRAWTGLICVRLKLTVGFFCCTARGCESSVFNKTPENP